MSNNKLPDNLTKEQLVKLFENMLTPKCSIACFMALMMGLRVSEICNLQIADVDLENRRIKIKNSKNPNRSKQGYGKDRIVDIPLIAVSPISKWISIIEGGKWVIPSENTPDRHLPIKTLHAWFNDARNRSGLSIVDYLAKYNKPTKYRKETTIYKYRFHHLRHFYATYVYEKTRDIYAVSTLLGHNQVSTTQIYAKISDKQRKETIDFAFNTPLISKQIQTNPTKQPNFAIPQITTKEKTPIEVLEERFARGEISDIEFQNKLRLLKLRKEYLKQNGEEYEEEIRTN